MQLTYAGPVTDSKRQRANRFWVGPFLVWLGVQVLSCFCSFIGQGRVIEMAGVG